MRRFMCAAVLTVFTVSVALAADFPAIVTKIDKGKVTFKKLPKEKGGDFGEETTLPLAKDAKISKGTFKKGDGKPTIEAGDPLDKDAVKALMEKATKGAFARVSTDTDGKHITELRIVQFGGKKKKKDNN